MTTRECTYAGRSPKAPKIPHIPAKAAIKLPISDNNKTFAIGCKKDPVCPTPSACMHAPIVGNKPNAAKANAVHGANFDARIDIFFKPCLL